MYFSLLEFLSSVIINSMRLSVSTDIEGTQQRERRKKKREGWRKEENHCDDIRSFLKNRSNDREEYSIQAR